MNVPLPPLDIGKLVQTIVPQTELGEVQAQLLFLSGQYVLIYKEQEKTHCKFVSPAAIARAFTNTLIDSGWLDYHTVRWGHGLSGEWIVQYYPPQQYQILCESNQWQIPLPAFIFVGYRTRYWIWASKTKQFDPNAALYAAPLPNVYGDGAICFGELHPPDCSPSQIGVAWKIFWQLMWLLSEEAGENEILFHLSFETGSWHLEVPAQIATPTSVTPLISSVNSSYETALIEVHSHANMSSEFSEADNREETGFRIFAILGKLRSQPEINTRIGIYSHFYSISARWVFELPQMLVEKVPT